MAEKRNIERQETNKGLVYYLMQSKYIPLLGSMFFFIIFGVAFYLIYIDLSDTKEQYKQDLSQRQLAPLTQASLEIYNKLDIIKSDFELIARLDVQNDTALLNNIIKSFEGKHAKIGLKNIGLTDSSGYNLPEHILTHILYSNVIKKIDSGINPATTILYDSLKQGAEYIILFGISPDKYIYAFYDLTILFGNTLGAYCTDESCYWSLDNAGRILYLPDGRNLTKAFLPNYNIGRQLPDNILNILRDVFVKEKGVVNISSGLLQEQSSNSDYVLAFRHLSHSLVDEGLILISCIPSNSLSKASGINFERYLLAQIVVFSGMLIFSALALFYHRKISIALKKQVSRREDILGSILENAHDAIIFTDHENKILVWNKGAEEMFGYSQAEMKGHSFEKIIPGDINAAEELQNIQKIITEKGYINQYIAPRKCKDGKIISANISRTLIKDEHGNILGNTVIIRDDSEREELERRIYTTEKLASIGTLAAGVAHEINNPLAVILGYTDLILDEIDKGSPYYKDLKTIEINANNAKKIVENMLGFARISEGMAMYIDIEKALNTVIAITQNTMKTKKIDFRIDMEEKLPFANGDPREFQQVILNLVNNAIAAMKNSGGILNIKVRSDEKKVFISVKDEGSGIPNRIKNNIFDPFFTTKDVGEGTGLGLSLSYGIIKKYGGNIIFTSSSAEDHPEEPSGTTFTVSLPVKKEI